MNGLVLYAPWLRVASHVDRRGRPCVVELIAIDVKCGQKVAYELSEVHIWLKRDGEVVITVASAGIVVGRIECASWRQLLCLLGSSLERGGNMAGTAKKRIRRALC